MPTDYRLMSAMVLFNFEQALGNWIIEKIPSINEEIADLAEHIQNRETQKRPSLKITNTSELIAETYIEDLFQLVLRIRSFAIFTVIFISLSSHPTCHNETKFSLYNY